MNTLSQLQCQEALKGCKKDLEGLLEVYQGWTDAASAGDLEEVY